MRDDDVGTGGGGLGQQAPGTFGTAGQLGGFDSGQQAPGSIGTVGQEEEGGFLETALGIGGGLLGGLFAGAPGAASGDRDALLGAGVGD